MCEKAGTLEDICMCVCMYVCMYSSIYECAHIHTTYMRTNYRVYVHHRLLAHSGQRLRIFYAKMHNHLHTHARIIQCIHFAGCWLIVDNAYEYFTYEEEGGPAHTVRLICL